MIHPEYVRLMASYNAWMNERLYALCANLPAEQLHADRGAFFRSIHGTLEHLMQGDSAWMARFGDRHAEVRTVATRHWSDFAEMHRARTELDLDISRWAAALREPDMHGDLTYTSALSGKTFTRARALLIVHMFNHQTHHRGQVTTVLTQLGYDIGVTDLPLLTGND